MADPRISGTPGAQPTPQQQPPKLTDEERARLLKLGISQEAIDKGPAAVQAEAQAKGIDIKPQQPADANIPIGQPTGDKKPAAESGLERTEAQEGDELRREGEKVRHEVDKDFIAKQKAYHQANAEYETAKAEYDLLLANDKKVYKKNFLKKNVKLADGTKISKKEAREQSDKALSEAKEKLAAARQKLDDAKKALGGNLAAANQYAVDHAETDAEKERAARIQVRDRVHSQEGRQAIKDQMEDFSRGDADHKLKGKEKKERANEIQDEMKVEIKGKEKTVSGRYAKKMIGRAEKNLAGMEKEDALQKIIIGNKDTYKAEKKDDENGNPTVNYMDEKLYKKTVEFAASVGIALPEDATELTDDQMREVQQAIMEATGEFGDRADLNESRGIDDKFRNISAGDFRKMCKAFNVDYQKDYTWVAVAGGVAASLATGGFQGGITKLVGALADQVIPGGQIFIPGGDGVSGSGHWEKLEDIIIPGKDGHRTLDWKKLGISALAGVAVEELLRAILNNDTNLLKKGKTLKDAVYAELDGLDAFKKYKPNAKVVLANILADQSLSREQKLAYMAMAMGDGGPKLSPRELTSAYIAMKAHQNGGEAPVVDVKPEYANRKIYDLGNGVFMDENGNELSPEEVGTYIKDGKVSDDQAEAIGSRATAYDETLVHDKYKNNKDFSREDTTQVDENGNLRNYNKKTERSQYVVSDEKGEVQVKVGNGSPLQPEGLILLDDTNHVGQRNKYEYRKLSAEEAKQRGLEGEGPFYETVKAWNAAGKEITQNVGKVFKLTTQEVDRGKTYKNEVDEEGYTTKRTTSDTVQVNYHMDAVTAKGKTSATYSETGATPKVSTPATKPTAPKKPTAPTKPTTPKKPTAPQEPPKTKKVLRYKNVNANNLQYTLKTDFATGKTTATCSFAKPPYKAVTVTVEVPSAFTSPAQIRAALKAKIESTNIE